MIVGHIGGGGGEAYEIEKSLRFRANASPQLDRTPGSAGNRKTWTWSGWVKRATIASAQTLFAAGSPASDCTAIQFESTGQINFFSNAGGSAVAKKQSTSLHRDPTGHYHVVAHIDTTRSTASDRMKLWVNGVQVTSFSLSTDPALNLDTYVNATVLHTMGRASWASGNFLDGYLSEIHFIDGQALDASSFGAFDANGVWVPLAYTGTYGTNGFYLPFSNGSSFANLTADASGNGNNWSSTNHSLTLGVDYDWMDDTPTNNFAVLNPLDVTNTVGTLTSGNLTLQQTVSGNVWGRASIPVTSGKYYVEYTLTTAPPSSGTSIQLTTPSVGAAFSYNAFDGTVTFNGSLVAPFATSGIGTVLAIAVDRDANTLDFYRNNVLIYSGTALASGPATFRAFLGASGGVAVNFGQRPFTYTPPTGYQKLCTANLTNTTITTSGSFTGNANADGPTVWLNGVPTAMTINGNAVTFATHADRTAGGFKVRSSSASYNAAGTNTYSITSTGAAFKNARAQVNP